jgi:hypothetical protein
LISQKCPRCGSERLQRGYLPTPWWSAIICRYNLLCKDCNWEFFGFALFGTVPKSTRQKKQRPQIEERKSSQMPNND